MEPDLTHRRQNAHAFLDRLPADQLSAVCGLLETMLTPLDRKLAVAPFDDEPLTPEDAAASRQARPRWNGTAACPWKKS